MSLLSDRRFKLLEIAEPKCISKERIHHNHILHEELSIKKLYARWVLRLLKSNKDYLIARPWRGVLDFSYRNVGEALQLQVFSAGLTEDFDKWADNFKETPFGLCLNPASFRLFGVIFHRLTNDKVDLALVNDFIIWALKYTRHSLKKRETENIRVAEVIEEKLRREFSNQRTSGV